MGYGSMRTVSMIHFGQDIVRAPFLERHLWNVLVL